MIFIKVGRKASITAICILFLFLFFILFGIFNYIQRVKLSDKYDLLACYISEIDKTGMIRFLMLEESQVNNKYVEIFGVVEGRIVKTAESNNQIIDEAKKYLKGITGMYVKANALPVNGYIVKIPFKKSYAVKNEWLNANVSEVFVIYPEQEPPYLLVLDSKKRPVFYNFKGNAENLLKILNFNPLISH